MIPWHTFTIPEAEERTASDFRNGLSSAEAQRRLAENGWNELPEPPPESVFSIFLRQFRSPLIYVLAASALVILFFEEYVDASLIAAVLFFNAIIGTLQEGKAQKTLSALKHFARTSATVIRDGKETIVPDRELAQGDLIVLREGERVPADARVIESHNMKVDEAALTGESAPVHKLSDAVHSAQAILANQTCMVFKGTAVVGGHGKAVAVGVGRETAIGRISEAVLSTGRRQIPLERNVERLSQTSIYIVGIISLAIFLFGIFTGRPLDEMFTTVISLAIAVIPEGLPIALTLILARGMWDLAKRNVLIKKLQAVEALGEAKVIAVDKTGTLTKNEMVVRSVYVNGKMFALKGDGYEPKGEVRLNGTMIEPAAHPELLLVGKLACFGGSAQVAYLKEEQAWHVSGDPTEAALLVFGEKLGFTKENVESEFPPISELPFDYATKLHLAAYKTGERTQTIAIAGAPETVLAHAAKYWTSAGPVTMTREMREDLEKMLRHLSRTGLRVVGLGYKETPIFEEEETLDPNNLIFAGLCGIEDSLRPEVPQALAAARQAGIRVIMITGDSKLTATAVGKQAGILEHEGEVLADDELERLTEQEFLEKLDHVSVFARVVPEHKMRIIDGFRKKGITIAMTGDGVNDAPSLAAADLGVAMGKIGTEVAKEAADIIVLDDNFGGIVAAVEEGRHMFATIKKTILFLFSTNIGEIIAIAAAIFVGLPIPLLAPQILWLNLITDSPVAFALALDTKNPGLLRGSYRSGALVDRHDLFRMLLQGVVIAAGTLYLFQLYAASDLPKAWTMALTSLALFQWFNGWNCRSDRESAFKGFFDNVYLFWAVVLSALLHAVVLQLPLTQKVLHVVPLSGREWLLAASVAASVIVAEELRKFFSRPAAAQGR
jgi:P-type Ca2+ transporter type 2C